MPGRVSAGAAKLGTLLVWLCLDLLLAALCLDILDGKVNLGWAVGMAAGGFLCLRIYPGMDAELRRRQQWAAGGAVVLAAMVLLAPRLTPDGLTAPLYPDRPLAEARLLEGEDNWCVRHPDEASLLVSCSRWEEGAEDGSAWLEGRCWHIRSALLADRLLAQYQSEAEDGLEAPPGMEGVWTGRVSAPNGWRGELWLIRRGNVIVRIEAVCGLVEEQDLQDILAQLEGPQ